MLFPVRRSPPLAHETTDDHNRRARGCRRCRPGCQCVQQAAADHARRHPGAHRARTDAGRVRRPRGRRGQGQPLLGRGRSARPPQAERLRRVQSRRLRLGQLRHRRPGDHRPGHAALSDASAGTRHAGPPADAVAPGRSARAPRSSASSPRPPARTIPASHIWSIWNEPNLYSWLGPQRSKGTPLSPSIYRNLYLAGHKGLSGAGHTGDTFLLGELMPRGGTSPSKVRPLEFLREMACLDSHFRQIRGRAAKKRGCRKVGRFPASGIAYHPYTPPDGPHVPEGRDDAAIGQLSRLRSTIDALARRGKLPRRLPIWITEFGYQTKPPDPIFGTSLRKAASFMDESEWISFRNSRVKTYSQYTLSDDPPRPGSGPLRWSSWQAGLHFLRRPQEALRIRRVPPALLRAHAQREPGRGVRRATHAHGWDGPDRVQVRGRQLPCPGIGPGQLDRLLPPRLQGQRSRASKVQGHARRHLARETARRPLVRSIATPKENPFQ